MALGKRIAEMLAVRGKTQSALARAVGIDPSSINQLIHGTSNSSRYLHQIARELGTTPAYLVGETDDPEEGAPPALARPDVTQDLGLVPIRELDLTLGMGSTYLDIPVTETVRYYPLDWVRSYTRSPPENLFFAQGVGDSMAPTLLDSDLLLIDCSQRHLSMSDKIWAIAYAGCGMVKRLRPVPNGGVEILSDNQLVPTATAYDGEMELLGRLVAAVRKF